MIVMRSGDYWNVPGTNDGEAWVIYSPHTGEAVAVIPDSPEADRVLRIVLDALNAATPNTR